MKFFVGAFLIVLSHSLQASSGATLSIYNQAFDFKASPNLVRVSDAPFKSSVEAIAQVRFFDLFRWNSAQPEIVKYRNKKWIEGKLKYHVYRGSGSKWVFFAPGIFSYLNSSFVKHMVSQLLDLGLNVVVIPNHLTSEFQRARPHFSFGDLTAEARLTCELIGDIQSQEPTAQKMSLLGLSYGGLLASRVGGECADSFDRVTIVSPPIYLVSSFRRVLDFVAESVEKQPDLNRTPYWWLYLKTRLGQVKHQALLSRFFLDGLYYNIYLAKKNSRSYPQQEVDFAYDSEKYHQWQKNVSIPDFYFGSAKDKVAVLDRTVLSLMKNLSVLVEKDLPFIVLSAQDDPINKAVDWRPLTAEFSSDRILLLDRGGHMGFAGTDWFREVIRTRLVGSK